MSNETRAPAPAGQPATRSRGISVSSSTVTRSRPQLAGEDRYRLIAEAAYFHAEQRGFAPGSELEDWLRAEIEIDALFDAEDERR